MLASKIPKNHQSIFASHGIPIAPDSFAFALDASRAGEKLKWSVSGAMHRRFVMSGFLAWCSRRGGAW